jgi:DNA polymerase III delta prime subunit
MMDDLILDASVRDRCLAFTRRPSHALMLIGPEGSGKGALARHIALSLLNLNSLDALSRYPYLHSIEPVDGVHPIAAIRGLQERLRLKTPGSQTVRRVIIIDSAHLMTTEAQNAFLKMLEEPPADTVIIMNVVGHNSLLPTVYSRAQRITIKPPERQLLMDGLGQRGYDQGTIEKNFHVSGGQIGLLMALISKDAEHPLAKAIQQAKILLTSSAYERLLAVESLAKQKQDINLLLQALSRIAHAALHQASQKSQTGEVERWHKNLEHIHRARYQAGRNANSKLLLTDLMLRL